MAWPELEEEEVVQAKHCVLKCSEVMSIQYQKERSVQTVCGSVQAEC